MLRTVALRVLVLSAVGVGAAYASAFRAGGAPAWGVWLFIVSLATLVLAMMTLGALPSGASGGRRAPRGLWVVFAAMLVVMVAGFGVALVLPPDRGPDAALWLGLPRRAAIVLYGVGLLPLFVLPIAYALTFDRMTLSEADIERVRAWRVKREG